MNADKALYYVKQNGKDQTFSFTMKLQQKMDMPGTSEISRDLETSAQCALRESGSYSGALDLDYRDFARIYEYINSLVRALQA